jgi:hypothetical protein
MRSTAAALVVLACACRTPPRATPERSVAADPVCQSSCLARYGAPPDAAAYATYCDELCTPGAGPSSACVASCEKYQQRADTEACAGECASVPTVSDDSIAACAAACVADGGGEAQCSIDCDPDPYDACRYAPCD